MGFSFGEVFPCFILIDSDHPLGFFNFLLLLCLCSLSPPYALNVLFKLTIARPHRFADLKRGLTAVTDSEWENLPEVSNMTGKKQKRNPRFDREYAVPDSVTLTNMASNATEGQLSEEQMGG